MTPRDIIEKALRKIGEIGSGETATNDEVQDGLDELNMMIDGFNQDKLFSYTETRIKGVSIDQAKMSMTISDINADQVSTIVSDGYTNSVVLKDDDNDYELYNQIRPYGYLSFLNDKTILEISGSNITTAPETIPADNYTLQTIVFDSVTRNFELSTNDDNSYQVGDILSVTDNDGFTGFGEVTIKADSKSLTLENCTSLWDDAASKQYNGVGNVFLYSEKVAVAQEDDGYIHLTTANVADIISPRPYDIERILDDAGEREVVQWQNSEWTADRTGFTYYTDFPKGTIVYGSLIGDVSIHYRKLNENVKLYDELDLPPGYASTWVYELARLLGVEYGVDVTAVAFEAGLRISALRRVNHKTPLLSQQTPRGSGRLMNFETGRRR